MKNRRVERNDFFPGLVPGDAPDSSHGSDLQRGSPESKYGMRIVLLRHMELSLMSLILCLHQLFSLFSFWGLFFNSHSRVLMVILMSGQRAGVFFGDKGIMLSCLSMIAW
ncbi:hypothetical protein SLE2022_014550 [Rubroshorea leprosula]